ncbi:MAG: hypothetical protein FHK79_16965 [Pseudomonas sp.]|nr:MAG: hypothetical protein FHK79_16965 [Pseudomonas sp.]
MRHTPPYEQRVIGFVDILGFGQLVADSESDGEKFRLIHCVLEKINQVEDVYGSPEDLFAHSNYASLSDNFKKELDAVFDKMRAKAQPTRVTVTTFSDSIVFSSPASSAGLANFRYFLIKLLAHTNSFQLLLRGGISCGSLVHTEQMIFGPAMNQAYYLESKVAKNPRIVVDEDFETLVEKLEDQSLASLIRSELVRQHASLEAHFDTLSLATNKVAQNMCKANAYEILVNEKITIESLMRGAPSDPNIMSKLYWYVSYYNDFLERTREVEVVVSQMCGMPLETIMVPITDLRI